MAFDVKYDIKSKLVLDLEEEQFSDILRHFCQIPRAQVPRELNVRFHITTRATKSAGD